MNSAHNITAIYGNRLLTKGISVPLEPSRARDVVFRVLHFAFAAYSAPHNDYVRVIN